MGNFPPNSRSTLTCSMFHKLNCYYEFRLPLTFIPPYLYQGDESIQSSLVEPTATNHKYDINIRAHSSLGHPIGEIISIYHKMQLSQNENIISCTFEKANKDLVLLLKEIHHNQPQCFIAEQGEYTAMMLNFIPMIAESQKEVEKVKDILNKNYEMS